jgi:sugar/nucleoside kinase (ribokinase family)
MSTFNGSRHVAQQIDSILTQLPECGRLGSVAAAEVISHMGPRPETSLRALAGL